MHLKSTVQTVSSIAIAVVLFTACSKKAEVNFYDKSLKKHPLHCLQFTPNQYTELERSLEKLYHFQKKCKNTLELSFKSNIICKSPYNAAMKSTSNFPNAYLKLEVRNGFKLLYSYYIDLLHKPTKEDLKEGFERLKDDIL